MKTEIINGKTLNIFAEGITIEQSAMEQMYEAMKQDFVVQGAIMPDSHKGYTLPIGAVVSCRDYVVPAYVGFDIGCGLGSIQTNLHKSELHNLQDIHTLLHEAIPTGNSMFHEGKMITVVNLPTEQGGEIFTNRKGSRQLGTLGGGNHFLEVGYDEEGFVWITVHSGSRGTGHGIAGHYMKLAAGEEGSAEGHHGLHIDSVEGKDYIQDLNFCLEYAVENRGRMLQVARRVLSTYTGKVVSATTTINRNHNHAELKDGLWIHRKGATHAEKGMLGVIPANMRDGVFIVEGQGNPDSLCSSSHGAGRVLGRYKAKKVLRLEDFEKEMEGVAADVRKDTLDESPDAYKNIFEVMAAQQDLVQQLAYVRPLISVKG